MNKYFNDCIIGNSSILASLNNKGELMRFYAPNIDYMQHIDEHKVGIMFNEKIYWLDDENIFSYEQWYENNTNILKTRISNNEIKILQTDYIDVYNDVMVRKYIIESKNEEITTLDLVIYSKVTTDTNRFISGWYNEELNSLIQYGKDSYFNIFSKNKIIDYQINKSENIFNNPKYFNKEDYIGMSHDSSIKYRFNEDKEITYYIGFRDSLIMSKNMLDLILKIDERLMYEDTKKYWEKIIEKCETFDFASDKEKDIYIRSILLLIMYTNDKTGGMIAGCEVDEKMNKCGRYSFCWPRDSAYLTEALNICGLSKISEIFYTRFCIATQLNDGGWEQRYYTDGNLAPCWGVQIDETASTVIGMIKQYLYNNDDEYLKTILPVIDKAIEYLLKALDTNDTLSNVCYDLWETERSKHLYTLASIYYAFDLYINNIISARFVTLLKIKMEKMYNNILNIYWKEELGYFKRNTKDNLVDVSTIGIIWPFEIFNPLDDKIINNVNKIEERLKGKTGGISRFENDNYVNNNNSWILCTLWLSMYYVKKYKLTFNIDDLDKAKQYYDFVTNHCSKHGFLAEQVDENTDKPIWVNGLAWSHAMYIICTKELYGNKN